MLLLLLLMLFLLVHCCCCCCCCCCVLLLSFFLLLLSMLLLFLFLQSPPSFRGQYLGLLIFINFCCVSQNFTGNKDRNTVVTHWFPQIKARHIRVLPLKWSGLTNCMRIELFGCRNGKYAPVMRRQFPPEIIQYM